MLLQSLPPYIAKIASFVLCFSTRPHEHPFCSAVLGGPPCHPNQNWNENLIALGHVVPLFYSSLPFLSGGQPCNPNQKWSQNLAVPWQVLSIRILSCQIVKYKLQGTGIQAIAFSMCSACRKTITDLGLWKRICNLCLQNTSGPRLTPRAYCFLKTSVANSLYQPRSVIPNPTPISVSAIESRAETIS